MSRWRKSHNTKYIVKVIMKNGESKTLFTKSLCVDLHIANFFVNVKMIKHILMNQGNKGN